MHFLTALDLDGFTPVPDRPDFWTDDAGSVLSVHEFGLVPDVPAALDDLASLRRLNTLDAAGQGVAAIEIDVVAVDGLPAMRQVLKTRIPGRDHGLVFIGSFTLPRADRSVVVKVQAAEQGMTGLREALVFNSLGAPDKVFLPHPYAPDAQLPLPYSAADAPEWDARFPDHPLTRVRAVLARQAAAVRVAETFRSTAPFVPAQTGGSAAPDAAPAPHADAERRWFRRG
ncbi:hypothetical protein GCM10023205_65520 [Yinghuangia aomiensis]|uniref:Uncharacterized protein n=1 Tax=Yinghuangia aomiensis TaxID=676205 RepID=A0ABP9I2P2_9ACTN